jgi:hypothetical protein
VTEILVEVIDGAEDFVIFQATTSSVSSRRAANELLGATGTATIIRWLPFVTRPQRRNYRRSSRDTVVGGLLAIVHEIDHGTSSHGYRFASSMNGQ